LIVSKIPIFFRICSSEQRAPVKNGNEIKTGRQLCQEDLSKSKDLDTRFVKRNTARRKNTVQENEELGVNETECSVRK